MTVITRFAPSPTGFLHIGGARTALFNWLYAKHCGGQFLLRVEDTDRERSTQEAIDAILSGMEWMGLHWDGDVVFQHQQSARHKEVAEQLLADGKAYYCYCTPEELAALREKGEKYDRRWRDRSVDEAPEGVDPVIRLKAPLEGEIIVEDAIQGTVRVDAKELDDFVLVRSDGTPTYMLAVVVDDHDMGITHIIRGDDHLTNAFRQTVLYVAMGWDVPIFAHMSLIHGEDGKKLSKRHGALGVEAYRDMGYLPEALCNYLLRLGWSHGDEEIISQEQAIAWFGLEAVGKAPARFDKQKLGHLNGHYIREADNARLVALVRPLLGNDIVWSVQKENWLLLGIDGLKQRVKNINELAENARFYVIDHGEMDAKASTHFAEKGRAVLMDLIPVLEEVPEAGWMKDSLFPIVKEWSEKQGVKMKDVAQALRSAICYSTISPSMFEVMEILGKAEVMARIQRL